MNFSHSDTGCPSTAAARSWMQYDRAASRIVVATGLSIVAMSMITTGASAQVKQAPSPTTQTPIVVTTTAGESAVELAGTMKISVAAAEQIQAIDADKDARTPTQKKICSDLIYLSRMNAGKPAVPGVPTLATISKADANGCVKAVIRVVVDAPINADAVSTARRNVIATSSLTNAIVAAGGQIINNAGSAILVNVPLAQLENIAALPNVGFIDQYLAPRFIGNAFGRSTASLKASRLVPYKRKRKSGVAMRPLTGVGIAGTVFPFPSSSLTGLLLNLTDYNGANTGTIDQGVTAHDVATAYNVYGVSGLNSTLASLTTTHPGGRLRVGVLSDSDTNLSASQGDNDTPPTDSSPYGTGTSSSVTIVVDDTQNPSVSQDGTGEGEGTAIMEIVHDMMPDAKLFFATANSTEQQFAKNIELLRFKYHCDIIIDDVGYFAEAAFSDDVVAQAVNQVTADGGMYFSSAGNEGHISTYSYPNSVSGSGTSTGAFPSATWEGDFASGGAVTKIGNSSGLSGSVHAFNSGTKTNQGTVPSYGQVYNIDQYPQRNYSSTVGYVLLGWADPPTGSSNDYDLYITNAGGTSTYYAGTTTQDGSSGAIPFEIGISPAGDRVYILKKTAAATRALHLTTYGTYYDNAPSLQFVTNGTTYGHPATVNGFGVAAVPATTNSSYGAYDPNAGSIFKSNNTSESFSSDGPRTVFYTVTGGPNLGTLAVTPTAYTLPNNTPTYTAIGNGTFAGTSSVRNQPVVAAADGVTAGSTAAFTPFFGTSAAGPHAASVAGLLMSYHSSSISGVPGLALNGGLISVAEMHTLLQTSTIDIEAAGYDYTTGYGIVMPASAIYYFTGYIVPQSIDVTPTDTTATFFWDTRLPASTVVNYGTTAALGSTLTGLSGVNAHQVTLTSLAPGTKYYYTVTSNTATGSATYTSPAPLTFTTAAVTPPALALQSASLATSGGVTTATITIVDNGGASTADTVTAATLASSATTTTLPDNVGPVGAGSTQTFMLTFPAVASGRRVMNLTMTDSAGVVYTFALRITAP